MIAEQTTTRLTHIKPARHQPLLNYVISIHGKVINTMSIAAIPVFAGIVTASLSFTLSGSLTAGNKISRIIGALIEPCLYRAVGASRAEGRRFAQYLLIHPLQRSFAPPMATLPAITTTRATRASCNARWTAAGCRRTNNCLCCGGRAAPGTTRGVNQCQRNDRRAGT